MPQNLVMANELAQDYKIATSSPYGRNGGVFRTQRGSNQFESAGDVFRQSKIEISPSHTEGLGFSGFLPKVSTNRCGSTLRASKSPNWNVSKFDSVHVSPHRLRKALGEYRKQTYKRDYIEPCLFDKPSQASIEQRDEIKDKMLNFDESIEES